MNYKKNVGLKSFYTEKELAQMNKGELIKIIQTIQQNNEINFDLIEKQIQSEDLSYSWTGNLGRWLWNINSGLVTFNPAKVENLGYNYEDFDPQLESFTSLIHPEDYDKTMQVMRNYLSGKTNCYETEYRIKCKNGNYKIYYDRGNIVERDKNGSPVKMLGIVFDITQDRENKINNSKIIHMCAACKKVDINNNNKWIDISVYLYKYLDKTVSHSICPNCIEKLYPNL